MSSADTSTTAKASNNGTGTPDARGLHLVVGLLRRYPLRSVAMLAALFAASLFEGFSVVTVLPLLDLATNSKETAPTGLSGDILSALRFVGLPPTMGALVGIIVGGVVAKAVFLFTAMTLVGYVVAQIATELRLSLVDVLMKARWDYFRNQPLGSLANAMNKEAMHASTVYHDACRILANAVQVVVYLVISLLLSWKITVLAVLAGGALVLIFRRLIGVTRRIGARQTRLFDALTRRLTDGLGNIKPLKAMAAESRVGPLLSQEARELNVAMRQQVAVTQIVATAREPIAAAFLAVALYFALAVWNLPFAAMLVLALMFYRITNWIGTMLVFQQSLAANEAYYHNFHRKIREARAAQEFHSGTIEATLNHDVKLIHIGKSVADREVLKDVSMTIPAGSVTVIVGSSGAGKTTISDLIMGLALPDRGKIVVDGKQLSDLKMRSWRRIVGYVPQEVSLFHDTVLINVTLGDPNVTSDDAQAALEAAGLWDHVAALPHGIETIVGERGSKLSGGERQRVAIARALVRQPKLLILDEPTTALDPATEQSILSALNQLSKSMTVVVISHQPAVAKIADVIYRVGDGTAVLDEELAEREDRLTSQITR